MAKTTEQSNQNAVSNTVTKESLFVFMRDNCKITYKQWGDKIHYAYTPEQLEKLMGEILFIVNMHKNGNG